MAHYYKPDGTLVDMVPMKTDPTRTRPTNITDAKALGLDPGTSTILRMLDKPMLDNWRVEQGVIEALKDNFDHSLPMDEVVAQIVRSSEDYTWATADFGSQVHQGISLGLQGKSTEFIAPVPVMLVVNKFWDWYKTSGLICLQSEVGFHSESGYGGTVDFDGYYNEKSAVVDFKTQEFTDPKKVNYYDEYPIQLASYALGLGGGRKRVSVVISRNVPGLVAPPKVWDDDERYNQIWDSLLNLWKLMNKWER